MRAAYAGAAGLLLGASLFFGGGSSEDPLVWIGGVAVLLAAAAICAVLLGLVPAPAPARAGVVFLALLAAFVVWNGLSIAWSIAPDLSWAYFNRGVVYVSFALVGLFVRALLPQASSRAAVKLALLLAAVFGLALAGKVVPAIFPDGGRMARLRDPVEYWNALALLAAMAVPLSLWLAADRARHTAIRAGGVALLYASIVVLFLTYSRGGIAVALVVGAAALALVGPRLETLAALIVASPPALAVSAWAFTQPGLADDRQPYDVRVGDGAWFGVVFTLVGALVAGIAYAAARAEARRPIAPERRRRLVRLASIGIAAMMALGLAGAAVRADDPFKRLSEVTDAFADPDPFPTEGPARLSAIHSNYRSVWWGEAWEAFEGQPLVGTGAGSFRLVHLQLRDKDYPPVIEPHSVPLQFLSETGLVGFLLFAAAAIAALIAILGSLRRLEGRERTAARALALGALAYLLHALVDFDWDFVALNAPLFLVVGLLIGVGRDPVGIRRRPLWAFAAALFACAAVFSLAAPWLAARRVSAAYDAIDRGDFAEAAEDASAARSLDPLSVEPLLAGALAAEDRGRYGEALRLYVRAVGLQPLNPDPWFYLGRFELEVLQRPQRARAHLERSRELDRFGLAAKFLDGLDA